MSARELFERHPDNPILPDHVITSGERSRRFEGYMRYVDAGDARCFPSSRSVPLRRAGNPSPSGKR
jgi:hypothetical protein